MSYKLDCQKKPPGRRAGCGRASAGTAYRRTVWEEDWPVNGVTKTRRLHATKGYRVERRRP